MSKDTGRNFILSIKGKECPLSDILDYGESDMLVYARGEEQIVLIGLVDLYGSTYFVYRFADNKLIRLGDLSFDQPADVEKAGVRSTEFTVNETKKSILKLGSVVKVCYLNKTVVDIEKCQIKCFEMVK